MDSYFIELTRLAQRKLLLLTPRTRISLRIHLSNQFEMYLQDSYFPRLITDTMFIKLEIGDPSPKFYYCDRADREFNWILWDNDGMPNYIISIIHESLACIMNESFLVMRFVQEGSQNRSSVNDPFGPPYKTWFEQNNI